MKRQPVESSSIAEIGYAARERVLEILFRNGGLYRYFDVPRSVHRALVAAESIGRYLNRHVRNRYRYRRVDPPGGSRRHRAARPPVRRPRPG